MVPDDLRLRLCYDDAVKSNLVTFDGVDASEWDTESRFDGVLIAELLGV